MASSTVEKPKSDAVNSAADGSGLDADGGSSRSHRLRAILPIASVVVFLAAWQVVGGRVDPILFATPTEVAKAFWDLLRTGQLGPAFGSAMGDLATGYILAMVVGIAVGVVMGRSPVVARVLDPYVNFFQATPLIALVPLVVIWFGVGFEARVTVTFMLAVWSIIINTATGVKQTPPSLIDVGRVYKLSRWRVITGIAIPNAVPNIFAGLRIALGKALIGMVIAQMEISVTGLGGLVINYGNAFKTAYLLAAVCTASLVGVVAAAALEVVRRLVFPWTQGEDWAAGSRMNLDRAMTQTPTLCRLKGMLMSTTERRIRPARKVLIVAAAIAIAITAAACSGRTSSSGADSTGLKGARFTLMLQSTANANKVVEVHAVNALKAQGVNASIKWNASSPNIAITQLTAGTIDAYSEAVLGGVGAVASGIKMKDFALAQPRQDYVLLANSGINTLADLKGKKIGIQDTTGVNYAQALMVVQKAGLTPKDVDIIAVGGQSTRLPALVAGRVDATMLSHAAEQQLGPKGFKTIFDYTKDASNLYDDNIFASEEWLGKNSALAVALNKAILDSFEWFNDPANKDAVVTEALAVDPAADKDATATVFENLRAANAYPNGTILDPALIDQQQQLYQEAGSLPATVPVAQWVDDSFAKQAKGQS